MQSAQVPLDVPSHPELYLPAIHVGHGVQEPLDVPEHPVLYWPAEQRQGMQSPLDVPEHPSKYEPAVQVVQVAQVPEFAIPQFCVY